MDYEAKLILERLIEAINNNQVDLEQLVNAINNSDVNLDPLVKAVDCPDWWTIGITVVNALIMIWLGWKQYKLQKEQSISQEYAIYRKLYELVKTMDGLIKKHLYDTYIYYGPLRHKYHEPFIIKIDQTSQCLQTLDEYWIDFELKFPNEKNTIETYKEIITRMHADYQLFHPMLAVEKEDKRDIKNILQQINAIEFIEDDNKKGQAILSLIDNDGTRDCIESEINFFLEDKKKLNACNLLSKIAKRCKAKL